MSLSILLALLAIAALTVRYIEARSLFIPSSVIEETPRDAGLEYREESVIVPGGPRLSAWFIPAPGGRGTVYFLHGNGGNISHRLEKIKFFHDMGLKVFIIDYRGYGRSSGSPSEPGLYEDSRAGYDFLVGSLGVRPREIIVYGESLGGAVAVDLAQKKETAGVIVEGTFSSLRDMARVLYPFLPPWFVRARFDSFDKIASVKAPKLFLHSRSDEIVPFALGQRLFERATEPKKMVVLGGSHNLAFSENEPKLRPALDSFFDFCLKQQNA